MLVRFDSGSHLGLGAFDHRIPLSFGLLQSAADIGELGTALVKRPL